MGGKRDLAERKGFACAAAGEQQGREIASHAIGVRMLGTEHLLVDRQRALEERPRPRKVALGLQQAGEVVEARRRIGMSGRDLLADRQRAA